MERMPFSFSQITKPTLLLNEAAARANITRIAEKARAAGVRFRPHFKTHQSAEIGEWFRPLGVSAITTSSLDMALYFAAHGWQDITIAFPANLRQASELAELAGRVQLGLLVESAQSAARLGSVLHAPAEAWIKIDVGGHRTGLAWDNPQEVLAVAQAIQASGKLRLRGLLTHASQTYSARGAAQVCQRYAESVARICGLREQLTASGLAGLEVSVGDTPGSSLCALGPVDEIRPGNFVFYDAQQVQIGSCRAQDVAAALACPVVARHPQRGEVIVYGGAIHLSKDFLVEGETRMYGKVALPLEDGQGARWSEPLEGAYVAGLSQEHGIVRLPPAVLSQVQVGDLLCILPAHSCLSVTLMKEFMTLDGRMIETFNK